jgi:HD-GYP domain-containing protein (c-di-GMP phosphodiesterase class II)
MEIPLGARIFAIADTLDAMTSDRPYRKGTSFAAARAEIIRCSGTQFDPAIVDVFLRIPDEQWSAIRSRTEQPGFDALTTI